MALFGGRRDIGLFISMNRELLENIIEQEVDYYKPNLEHTQDGGGIDNLYGEASVQKSYNPPLRVYCLMSKQDPLSVGDEQMGTDRSCLLYTSPSPRD